MISKLALSGIGFYQTRLSPRKGFRCAYSVLHGGTGCSGFLKHAIMDHGLWAALPKAKVRMAAFKDAADELNKENPRKKTKSRGYFDWCDLTLCAAAPCAGAPCSVAAETPKPDASGCAPTDCTPDCDVCSCG